MPGLTSAFIILSSLLPRCSVTLHIVLGMFDGNRNGGVAARRPRAPSPWRYPLLYRCARVLIQRRSLSLRVRGQCCAVYVSAPTSHTRSLRHLSVLSLRFSPTVSPTRSLDSLPLISSLIFVIARRFCPPPRRRRSLPFFPMPPIQSRGAPTCTRSLSTSTRSFFHGRTPSLRAHRATRLD